MRRFIENVKYDILSMNIFLLIGDCNCFFAVSRCPGSCFASELAHKATAVSEIGVAERIVSP